MSYSIVISAAVKFDIIAATDYYKNINPALAQQFILRLREAKSHIASSPHGFQIKYNQVRTLL